MEKKINISKKEFEKKIQGFISEQFKYFSVETPSTDIVTNIALEEIRKNRPNLNLINNLITHSLVDVNLKDEGGYTLLMWSSKLKLQKTTKLLLQKPEIDVNAQNDLGNTALMWACGEKFNSQIIRMLLRRPEIDINIKNNLGNTALIRASFFGHTENLRMLLQRPEIDVNAVDNMGDNALIIASYRDRASIVKLLLSDPRIDKKIKNKSKYAWGWATQSIREQFPELNPNKKVTQTSPKSLKLVKVKNKDVHSKDYSINDIIHMTYKNAKKIFLEECSKKHPDSGLIVNILMHSPLFVDWEDDYQRSVLQVLVDTHYRGEIDFEIIKMLHHIPEFDINWQDKDGRTVLHRYIERYRNYKDNKLTIKWLFQFFKIDVTIDDISGRNPFLLALYHDANDIFPYLLNALDDSNDKHTSLVNMALIRAVEQKNTIVIQSIFDKSMTNQDLLKERVNAVLIWASAYGDTGIVKWIIDKYDVDVNCQDRNGYTPIMWASEQGYLAIVIWLLERPEIDVNIKNNQGNTSIKLAFDKGHKQIVKLLIERPEIDICITRTNKVEA